MPITVTHVDEGAPAFITVLAVVPAHGGAPDRTHIDRLHVMAVAGVEPAEAPVGAVPLRDHRATTRTGYRWLAIGEITPRHANVCILDDMLINAIGVINDHVREGYRCVDAGDRRLPSPSRKTS